MKYTEIDLQCNDIMWFGVDKNGYIFECTTGGIGCVPDFVCNSKEETALLEEFFTQHLESSGNAEILADSLNELLEECKVLSEKGIYCFDVAIEEGKPDEYKKVTAPSCPITIDSLPSDIQVIMASHRINIDVQTQEHITVSHAF